MTQIIAKENDLSRYVCVSYTSFQSFCNEAKTQYTDDDNTIRPVFVPHSKCIGYSSPIHYDFSFSLHRHPLILKCSIRISSVESKTCGYIAWTVPGGLRHAIVSSFDMLMILLPNNFINKTVSVVGRLNVAKCIFEMLLCAPLPLPLSLRHDSQLTNVITSNAPIPHFPLSLFLSLSHSHRTRNIINRIERAIRPRYWSGLQMTVSVAIEISFA